MKKFISMRAVKTVMLALSFVVSSCGGGGGGNDNNTTTDNTGNTVATPGLAPKLVWTFDSDAKNPTTYIAACAESVMACEDGGSTMRDCASNGVKVCQDITPADGCCPQACSDQLIQELDSGKNDQDAFLKVFVYDRSCMPGITKNGAKP